MAAELARPGVEVIQEFRTVTPSIITPTLVPNVTGVCKQVVDVLVSGAAGGSQLNPAALISLPAFFIANPAVGSPKRYLGIGSAPNNQLVISVNESPAITIAFSDPTAFGLTPATVVDQVNKQLRAQLVSSVIAETVGTDRWQLRTIGLGEFQSIYIDPTPSTGTSPVVAAAFGIGLGHTFKGLLSYDQFDTVIPPTAMPDPNKNLAELAIEPDTIRAFLFTGSGVGLIEALRTQSFLQRGEVAGLAVTPEGSTNLTSNFPFFAGQRIWLKVNGGAIQAIAIPQSVTNVAQLLALLNGTGGFTGVVASQGGAGGLVFTHTVGGYDKTIEILAADTLPANALLGLSVGVTHGVSVQAIDDGNGDAVTPLLKFAGYDFTTSPGHAVLTGAGTPTLPPVFGSTLEISDGGQPQTIVFDHTETTIALVKAAVEKVVGPLAGGNITVSDAGGKIRFTNSKLGEESLVEIVGGTALSHLDTGTTPAVTLEGTVSLNHSTQAASYEGTVAVATARASASGQTFSLAIDGAAPVTISVGTAGVDHTDVTTFLAYLNGLVGITGVAVVSVGPRGGLLIKSDTVGALGSVTIGAIGTALTPFGLTPATTVGQTIFPTLGTQTFQVSINGAAPATITLASETAFAALATHIHAQVAALTATQGPNGGLVLTGTSLGGAATIEIIDNSGGAVQLLGLDPGVYVGNGETIITGATAYGAPFVPAPGDEIWINGVFYAHVTKVAPGALLGTLRIDKQVPITASVGTYWYIVAKNLAVDATTGITRPTPDFVLDLEGNIDLKHNMLRDIAGVPVVGRAPLYVAYRAVREDVTAIAKHPGLLRFNNTTELDAQLAPIDTENPLGLGLFLALLNAPGIQVTGLGVDAITADSPYGTVEAFTRAAEYLEGYEVYAIAPLTHDTTVAQVFATHVTFMSEPASKGERICIWNPEMPTHALDTLVASGTSGDALSTMTFDTKVVNLSTLLNNQKISPVGVIPVTEGVYLDIAGDDLKYSVESVAGGVVTIRTVFNAGENEDGYYSVTPLPLPIISTAFAVRVRGHELVTTIGTQDKNAVASTVAALGTAFSNRRFWMTFPDKAAANVQGLEQVIEGFYLNAAIVGMIGQQPPQQSFTNFPMTGFTQVIGSNNVFSERQLNQMAAGGAYVIVQDAPGGPLSARMALTTDLTSIETRTDSITKVVDFTAKFMRRGLRNFIGRFNISQGFLDTLGSVIQGLGGFLVETGVLIGLHLNSIVQDENARDTVLVDTTLDPPYPCNYIRLTLVV